MRMPEPHLTRFAELVRQGAASRDMHDSDGAGSYDSDAHERASERFVARELGRVELHARSLCEPLAEHVGAAARILDIGCGTGGTTVALAQSTLRPNEVVGIDASTHALEAAAVRAEGHGLGRRVRFVHVPAGQHLPFQDGDFDLVTCVSVLEFVGGDGARRALVAEMLRVLRPGGHLYLATPSPFRLRNYHSRRWLGDWVRQDGYPWSSTGQALRKMLGDCEVRSLARDRLRRHPRLRHAAWATPLLGWALPWQRLLARKQQAESSPGATER